MSVLAALHNWNHLAYKQFIYVPGADSLLTLVDIQTARAMTAGMSVRSVGTWDRHGLQQSACKPTHTTPECVQPRA